MSCRIPEALSPEKTPTKKTSHVEESLLVLTTKWTDQTRRNFLLNRVMRRAWSTAMRIEDCRWAQRDVGT